MTCIHRRSQTCCPLYRASFSPQPTSYYMSALLQRATRRRVHLESNLSAEPDEVNRSQYTGGHV